MLGDDPAERADTVEIVTDELDRMSRYVTDLVVLAKAEQPDFLVVRPVDLGDLATDVLQRVSGLGPASVGARRAAPRVGTVATLADPDRLGQAIVNLAANAVQHTADGDEIGLGVAVNGEHARLWVRDSGLGVDPDGRRLVVRPLCTAADNRTGRPEGAGIGLSIVDAIARAHGGAVTVASRQGHGATFTVSIPLTTPIPAPPKADRP